MYEKLKQVLAQEDTVLFVGAGISIWSGLPSWARLIEELAQFIEKQSYSADLVRAEAAKGDLLQAASYGFDRLTQQQIGEFIREVSRYGKAQPHEIHQKIVTLGPRCFITTNYDNLIEESLRRWKPDRFQRIVTNRHLTETAEIIQARALDFVFKPHGDAGDSDSIILTREQYRQLLPDGERHSALESVKMLLASRPVVYFGFGLRDPDFLYIRDLLANTYRGRNRDHYAVMPDITEAEVDYWRRNYGVHLVSYATVERLDKSRDHSPLLDLLDQLLLSETVPTNPDTTTTSQSIPNSSLLLSLTRHAARLMRVVRVNPEFPLRIHLINNLRSSRSSGSVRIDKFYNCPITTFLDEGPHRAVIIGHPGAGKSYALQQAAARFAERLHELCLLDPCPMDKLVIPVLVDLKLYQGDVWSLIEKTLPPDLSLESALQQFELKIFLDSFNEIPREYWESGAYETDFSRFMEKIGEASFVIGSRTMDGLDKLELPYYSLNQIEEEFVDQELRRLGFNIGGRFGQDIRQLLQKPFYFQLVTSGAVQITNEPHPRDIFQSLFLRLSNDFQTRFAVDFDLEQVLSFMGYEALNRGEEALSFISFIQIITTQLQAANITQVSASEVINWLVAKSILIPYSGARIAFFHQSVTEFLAAQELARRYQLMPHILREKILLVRWDQALFLTLSLLQPNAAKMFLKNVVELDLPLALRAVKFLEIGRDEVVTELLNEVMNQIQTDHTSVFALNLARLLESNLPVSEVHEPQLRAIMSYGNVVGAAAATLLLELKGIAFKDELLESMHARYDDFNYCNSVGQAIQGYISTSDIPKLIELADSLEQEPISDSGEENANIGFIWGIAEAIQDLDLSTIATAFSDPAGSRITTRSHILCRVLEEHASPEAFEIAADLLLQKVEGAEFAIYIIAEYGESNELLSWTKFGVEHVTQLVGLLTKEGRGEWALPVLTLLCKFRPDVAVYLRSYSTECSGLLGAALLYAVNPYDETPVFHILQKLAEETWSNDEQVFLLQGMDLNWSGHEQLFVQLLLSRREMLIRHLLESQYSESNLGRLEIGPVGWWLQWLEDLNNSTNRYSGWITDRLSHLFANHLKPEDQRAFVAEFNKKNSMYRSALANTILARQNDLSTEDFSEDAISFLLASLSEEGRGHLLGHTATENFVVERLLPLVPQATGILKKNLRQILRTAGSRHGRRYIEV